MKRWVVYFLIAGMLVGAGLFATVQLVRAQEPTPTAPADGGGWGGGGFMGGRMGGRMGRGMMGGDAGQGVMHEEMQAALAASLDMMVEDLEKAYSEGETFWDLAEEKGYTVEEAQQMMLDARGEALDQAVANGDLTQEQADQMKERMGSHTPGACMDDEGNTGSRMGRGRGGWRWNQDSQPETDQ